jgi:hypothetical protein
MLAITLSIASTWARAPGCSRIAATQRRPLSVSSDPREHGHPLVHQDRVQALRPAGVIVGESLAQPRLVAQPLDLLGRKPRLRQHVARQQHHQPASVEAIGLRSLAVALQRARPAGIGQAHIDATRLQLARDPAPAGRRLERDRVQLALPLLRPTDQRLARRREPLLDQLAALGRENRGLKDRLVDIDRGQHVSLP